MKYAELKVKTSEELTSLLRETRNVLQKARFSVHQKQLKNVRLMREYKKTIAKILTKMRGA